VVAVGEGSTKVAVGGTAAVEEGDGEAVAVEGGSFVDDGTNRGTGLNTVGTDVAVETGSAEGERVPVGDTINVGLVCI
jgi:hypothetical protein